MADPLDPGMPYTFRVRAVNGSGPSAWGHGASATPFDGVTGPCNADTATPCLPPDRFQVRVRWNDPFNGGDKSGGAAPFDSTDDSGFFWFFDPENVELVVKVLDGRPGPP